MPDPNDGVFVRMDRDGAALVLGLPKKFAFVRMDKPGPEPGNCFAQICPLADLAYQAPEYNTVG
jgi:hypothetical protein